jgi:hypothetical protein
MSSIWMPWAKLYLNQTDLAQTVSNAEVKIALGNQDGVGGDPLSYAR